MLFNQRTISLNTRLRSYFCRMLLPPERIDKMLSHLRINELNELQTLALDASTQDGDLVLLSDTGSGKTVAFLLPVLSFMDEKTAGTQALVIVPSRELAIQIEQVFKTMGTGFKVTCCYGGHLRETEENNLKEAPAFIVGTPGRLADHIRRGNIHTGKIKTLVLDEFDKSLELGFQEEMSFIIGSLPSLNKRILTSATTATDIPDFVGLRSARTLDFLSGEKSERLALQQVFSPDNDKIDTLFRLVCRLGNRSTVVFCNHRESVERVSTLLREKGVANVFYHGALEQPERDSALAKFRNGSSPILVTTDLAARGLDVPNIRYIIHYHLPTTEDVYTHRNGRTARVDASGTAIFLLSPEESLPSYIPGQPETIELPAEFTLPGKPQWTTLYISAGKKDKVNKVDIVGFFTNKGQLKKEDIGLIEVKDFFSYVAIRKTNVPHTLQLIKNEKLKNKKVKIEVAK
ncbi:superfamily II DNA/RNA helicase [Dinghuibacter silviterrae]|uniref:Superfamily II DNA/RNA helicase n=2 Tax=Dinghuibacter silviterrae TaxID=1539049 RepID=A0A4V3GM03_9BACT|nr:superfamily II DNA/RNA helicase [Dinghuibacter silviterrae]